MVLVLVAISLTGGGLARNQRPAAGFEIPVHQEILGNVLVPNVTSDQAAYDWATAAVGLGSDIHQDDPDRHFDNAVDAAAICDRWRGGLGAYLADAIRRSGPQVDAPASLEMRFLADRQGAIEAFAHAAHAIADFYAHTNWVELMIDQTNFVPSPGGIGVASAPILEDTCDPTHFAGLNVQGGYYNVYLIPIGGGGCPVDVTAGLLFPRPPAPFTYCHSQLSKDSPTSQAWYDLSLHPNEGARTININGVVYNYHQLAKATAIRETERAWELLRAKIEEYYGRDPSIDTMCLVSKLAWGGTRSCSKQWRMDASYHLRNDSAGAPDATLGFTNQFPNAQEWSVDGVSFRTWFPTLWYRPDPAERMRCTGGCDAQFWSGYEPENVWYSTGSVNYSQYYVVADGNGNTTGSFCGGGGPLDRWNVGISGMRIELTPDDEPIQILLNSGALEVDPSSVFSTLSCLPSGTPPPLDFALPETFPQASPDCYLSFRLVLDTTQTEQCVWMIDFPAFVAARGATWRHVTVTARARLEPAPSVDLGPLPFSSGGSAVATAVLSGTTTGSSTIAASAGGVGLTANIRRSATAPQPLNATVATYSANPTGLDLRGAPTPLVLGGPVGYTPSDVGGGFTGLTVMGAAATDTVSADVGYPAHMNPGVEDLLRLLYYTPAGWNPVLGSGLAAPTQVRGSGSVGGRFSVQFDGTSRPTLSDLLGAIFAVAGPSGKSSVSGGGGSGPIDTWVSPYAASVGGGVVSWRVQFLGGEQPNGSPVVPAGVQLKILRKTDPTHLTVVGESAVHDPRPLVRAKVGSFFFRSADSVLEFADGGLSMQPGDIIGLSIRSDPLTQQFYDYPFELGPGPSYFLTHDVGLGSQIDLNDPYTGQMSGAAPVVSVSLAPQNTAVGSNVQVRPVDLATGASSAAITFTNVTAAGQTTVTSVPSSSAPPPFGWVVGTSSSASLWDIATTASFTGPVVVCINYGGPALPDDPIPTLWHLENGTWVDRTFYPVDVANAVVCASVSSLSPFGVFRDRTPPKITASATSGGSRYTPGQWTNHSVVVTYACSDAESGIKSCSDPVTVATEGTNQTVIGNARDRAGNRSAVQFGGINIDLTPPVVGFDGNAGTYTVDQTVQIRCTATDALSGIATKSCVDIAGPAYTFVVGTNTYSATAADTAGNASTTQISFRVNVTTDALCALVKRFATDAGVASSLCQKLAAVSAAQKRGDAKAAQGAVDAFDRELSAQSGKAIPSAAAELLHRLAGSL